MKYNILRFIRSSIACSDKEIENIELIRQTSILDSLSHFFKSVLTNLQPNNDRAKQLVNEIVWIFVNFSADDDPNVLAEVLLPSYGFLTLINSCLLTYGQGDAFDDLLVRNILWIFGNLLGDTNPQVYEAVMNGTDLKDFLIGVTGWPPGMPSLIMVILPWLINSITMMKVVRDQEVVRVMLMVLASVSK